MAKVLLGLGANLGDREAALQSVIDAMAKDFTNLRCSKVYETPPWGVVDQPAFLNAVVAAETALSPSQVLSFAQACIPLWRRGRWRSHSQLAEQGPGLLAGTWVSHFRSLGTSGAMTFASASRMQLQQCCSPSDWWRQPSGWNAAASCHHHLQVLRQRLPRSD